MDGEVRGYLKRGGPVTRAAYHDACIQRTEGQVRLSQLQLPR